MKIYDISIPISPHIALWPGDPPVSIRSLSTINQGADANISQISMSLHTGTHIDAPKHYLDGAKSVDRIALEKLIGEVLLMEFGEDIDLIDARALKSNLDYNKLFTCNKVLFKTRNSLILSKSPQTFNPDYVGIDSSAAQLLAELDLMLIGMDYFSVAAYTQTEKVHKILLDKEIILLEGINLKGIPAGVYDLYCLPLPIIGADGAPARTILIKQND